MDTPGVELAGDGALQLGREAEVEHVDVREGVECVRRVDVTQNEVDPSVQAIRAGWAGECVRGRRQHCTQVVDRQLITHVMSQKSK